jgi:hypothetical protein
MTTSRQKAVGSQAERDVAKALGGVRVGMDGGPTDVVIPDYAYIQVKKVKNLPSLNSIAVMLAIMPTDLLRGVVVIERAGQGKRGSRTITFDLDEWAQWHGAGD